MHSVLFKKILLSVFNCFLPLILLLLLLFFFLSSAPSQICVPAKIFQNTVKRIQRISIYGPEVFEEALIDPKKTLRRDIVPRFIASELYRVMLRRINSVESLPDAKELIVSPPDSCPVCEGIDEDKIKEDLQCFDILDMISDRILYGHFLAYLQSIVASENILCARMIDSFKAMSTPNVSRPGNTISPGSLKMRSTPCTNSAAIELAWLIYRFFVAPGSAYEVIDFGVDFHGFADGEIVRFILFS